nr:hypothetical protein [Tanacetum cinerariifolium]
MFETWKLSYLRTSTKSQQNWRLSLLLSPVLPPRFATVVENALGATRKNVPSACQATDSPIEEEKNTNPTIKDAETSNMQ